MVSMTTRNDNRYVLNPAHGTIDSDGTGRYNFGANSNFLNVTAAKWSISTVTVDATATEINAVADASARQVAAGATLSATVATHGERTILLNTAAGSIVTLPAASGTGVVFNFLVTTTATTNSHIVKVTSTDTMVGYAMFVDDTSDNVVGFKAAGTDDTITLNRTTTGLAVLGSTIRCIDSASAVWSVEVFDSCSGTPATPFSATVS
jgi:hypothetical protein